MMSGSNDMWVILVAIAILAAPFVGAAYLRWSTARMRAAGIVWGNLESHASALMNDKTLNPFIGDLVESMFLRAGDGAMTRMFLFSLVFRRKLDAGQVASAVEALNQGQQKQLVRFAIYAILYDSLRTGLSGAFLRRIVLYWLLPTAQDKTVPVNSPQVAPIVDAASRAYHVKELCPA
jgi:hypothetical protein